MRIVYDGDGNRVSEAVGGVTTNYLIDSVNPTGYAQVVDELQNGAVTRTYSYGLERINENQTISGTWTASFYGYDGHGSVRQLTNAAGAVTDSYDYDAFGNLINSTGTTPNNYLFAGEAYDPALGLYYNRARYLNTTTGRFWSMDTEEGNDQDPLSLHKYFYAEGNPVTNIDPSGNEIDEIGASIAISMTLDSMPTINASSFTTSSAQNVQWWGNIAQIIATSLVSSAEANLNPANTPLFTQYFGQPASQDRIQKVEGNYEKIGAYLTHTITYHALNSSVCGQVVHLWKLGVPDNIWLGGCFFAAPLTGIDSKGGIVLHEVSHLAAGTGDTSDTNEADAENLADTDAKKAIRNANNYEYFAERSGFVQTIPSAIP
jgi:RHS repeat-associated protein